MSPYLSPLSMFSHIPPPRKLGPEEDAIIKASWEPDYYPVLFAANVWLNKLANGHRDYRELQARVADIVTRCRKKKYSPLALCEELRDFFREQHLLPASR